MLIQSIYGNPVSITPNDNPFLRVPMLIIIYFLVAEVEYAYFKAKPYRDEKLERVTNIIGYKLFLKINLITFPLTQILAYVFMVYFFYLYFFYAFLIEVGVIYFESYLFSIEFGRRFKERLLYKLFLKKTFIANALSFFIGFLAYLPVIFIIF